MKPGSIVLVRFPFTHLESSKKRPALVLKSVSLTSKVGIVTLAMITSKTDGLRLEGDYLIQDWEKAKLLHASLLRLSKIATVDLDLIERELGSLSPRDFDAVKKLFKSFLKPWL